MKRVNYMKKELSLIAFSILISIVTGHSQAPFTAGNEIASSDKDGDSRRIVEYSSGNFVWIGNWTNDATFFARYKNCDNSYSLSPNEKVGTSTDYNDVIVLPNKEVVIAGTCKTCNPSNPTDSTSKILIVRKDSVGLSTIAQKVIGTDHVNLAADRIIADNNDGFFVLGRYQAPLALLYYIARLDNQFNLIKDTLFLTSLGSTALNWNWGKDLILTSDNHLILTGNSNVFFQTTHLSLIKLDSSLNIIWSVVDSHESLGASVKENQAGNYIIGGSVNGETGWDMYIGEYDQQSGTSLQSTVKDNYGGDNERIYDLQITEDGNILIAGKSDTAFFGTAATKLIAIFDSNLNFLAHYTEGTGFLSPASKFTSLLPLNDSGTELIAVGSEQFMGSSLAILRRIDFAPIYGCITTEIVEIDYSKSINVFPNPAGDFIQFALLQKKTNATIKMVLFDQLGRIALNYSGNLISKIDVSSLKPGLYFGEIFCNRTHYTFKLIKK